MSSKVHYCLTTSADLLTLDPKSIRILEILKTSDASSLYKINKDGIHHVLKVVCREPGTGVVPYYHGYFERRDPADFNPHLKLFTMDNYHSPTILLEFLPGKEELDCVSYSGGRFEKTVRALREVHKASVQHYYVYPRKVLNVTEQKEQWAEDGKRVWVYFDVAMTYPRWEAMSEKGVEYCHYEEDIFKGLEIMLVS